MSKPKPPAGLQVTAGFDEKGEVIACILHAGDPAGLERAYDAIYRRASQRGRPAKTFESQPAEAFVAADVFQCVSVPLY